MSIFPRTPADALAEQNAAAAWLQRELDDFLIGRRRKRDLELQEHVRTAARDLLAASESPAAASLLAREWAGSSPDDERLAPFGPATAYFWTRVACAIEDGDVR